MKTFSYLITAVGFVVLSCVPVLAHSGRTDSSGGHFNRRTGSYHTHGSGSSSSAYSTPQYRTSYRTASRATGRATYSFGKLPAFPTASSIARTTPAPSVPVRTTPEPQPRPTAPKPEAPITPEKKEARAANVIRIAIQLEKSGKKDAATRWLSKAHEQYPKTTAAAQAAAYLHFRDSERPFRTWTDATGKHTVEAAFVDYDGVNVKLRKRSGGVITVKYGALSDTDQVYVEALAGGFPPRAAELHR